jgi:50S ribosomal protein L16 3-hydroxylase
MTSPIDLDARTPLLGGLSPRTFMRRHWHKKPLLVRGAVPGMTSPIDRAGLFALVSDEGVESRLVTVKQDRYALKKGPFERRLLPPPSRPGWTLLVQGLDLHLPAAHDLLAPFAFIPHARLDDLMISYASDGGGVGPHVDSYDVFLLQVHGRRRWRIGPLARPAEAQFVEGAPLKILARFEPTQDWLLEPGDMLYLPPGWAHEGVAEGECMTCSIGFRSPLKAELGREVLQRTIDAYEAPEPDALYRDPTQPATDTPGAIPPALQRFAVEAVERLLRDPHAIACAVGEVLSEPKPGVFFDEGEALPPGHGVRLSPRTRMVYDERNVYINGESFRAAGRDARAMHRLADARVLDANAVARLSDGALELLADWAGSGWLHAIDEAGDR